MIEIEREFDERSRFWGMIIKTPEGHQVKVSCNPSCKGEVNEIIRFNKAGGCRVWSGEYMKGRCMDVSDTGFAFGGVRIYVNKEGKLSKLEAHEGVAVKMDGIVLGNRQRNVNPCKPKRSATEVERLAIIGAIKKCEDENKLRVLRALAESKDEAKISFISALFGLHESQKV